MVEVSEIFVVNCFFVFLVEIVVVAVVVIIVEWVHNFVSETSLILWFMAMAYKASFYLQGCSSGDRNKQTCFFPLLSHQRRWRDCVGGGPSVWWRD